MCWFVTWLMGIFPESPSVIQRPMLHYSLTVPMSAAQHESLITKHKWVHKWETEVPIKLGTIHPVFITSSHNSVEETKQSALNNLML